MTNTVYRTLPYPANWSDKYNADNKRDTKRIIDWLNNNEISQATISKAADISNTTFNNVVKGKYISPPSLYIIKIMDTIERYDKRGDEGIQDCPFVETTVFRAVTAACTRAHLYRNFSVVPEFVGTGKTRSLKHYAAHNSGVIVIEATPNMNPGVFISELVIQTGAIVHKSSRHSSGTLAEKVSAVITALKHTDSLIVLDEAETVCTSTLEYLRRISDKAGVGVVLAGTEKLKPLIKDPQGRFGQISSRVGFWPPVIQGITKDDAIALARAAFGDQVEISDESLDALWQMCDGSARVLVSALIPAIKDYGLKKNHPLTPDLIFTVGNNILGFTTRSNRRGNQ